MCAGAWQGLRDYFDFEGLSEDSPWRTMREEGAAADALAIGRGAAGDVSVGNPFPQSIAG